MEEIKNENIVSLEELEFNPIYKVLDYKNSQGELKQITIFNLDDQQEQELLQILMKYSNVENKEVKFNVPVNEVISTVLPLMTNIQLPSDKESIDRIVNNPNDILKEVLLEITEKITKIIKLNFKTLQMTKSTLEDMNIDDEKLLEIVEKQKEIQELTIMAEKEKQQALQEKARTNEDIIRELAEKVNRLETEKLELMVKNEQTQEVKPKRKYNKKKKIEEDKIAIESKEDEIYNE